MSIAFIKNPSPSTSSGRKAAWMILLAAAVLTAGCLSIEEMAPPVDSNMVAIASDQGYGFQTLSLGRDMYLNQCISCHSAEPVDRYSRDQWEKILPDMAAEAKLDDAQSAALQAYVLTAYRAMAAAKSKAESTKAQRHEGTKGLDVVLSRDLVTP